jgi:hypothetical protein
MISKSDKYTTGGQVSMKFYITQHSRDLPLLKTFINYFGDSPCGYVSVDKELSHFTVGALSDIEKKIIPHFNKYPLLGTKNLDFEDWCKIAYLMKDRVHLTVEGIEQIRKIKLGMNTGRHNFEKPLN